jgi:DNA-binding transcriptional MerR regulator
VEKSAEAFRTISEVAEDLDLPQHVLRFWETRFGQIRPMKRGGGRRYYRPEDMDLLRGIKHLLYGEGYTIKGVQRILKEDGVRFVQAVGREGVLQPSGTVSPQAAPQPPEASVASRRAEPAATKEAAHAGDPLLDVEITPTHVVGREVALEDPVRHRSKGTHLPLFDGLPGTLPPASREALRRALAELETCRRMLADADPAEATEQGFEGAA